MKYLNRIIVLLIIFVLTISVFTISAFAELAESDSSYFAVLPNRNYGISVNVHLAKSIEYDSLLVVVAVEEREEPCYIIEVGISEKEGIIFTEPTPLGYEAEPNQPYLVMVNVILDNIELVGAVSIQTDEYATVSSPIKADLAPLTN